MYRNTRLDAITADAAPPSRRQRMAGAWNLMSPNLQGSLLCVLSFALYIVMGAVLKPVAQRLPIIEVLFARQTISLVLLLTFNAHRLGRVGLLDAPGFVIARGAVATLGSSAGFTALAFLPLADSNAIGFAEILFVTVMAALILKEQVGWRRWTATLIGFSGVLLMLSPFGAGVNAYTGLALFAPLLGAVASIMVRMKGASENAIVPLFWQAVITLTLLAIPCWFVFVPPSPHDLGLIAVIGVLSLASAWIWVRAFQTGEASALAPMHFTRLIMAGIIGWFAFGDVPTGATLIGALLVVGSTIYTLKRNAVRGVPADAAARTA